MEQQLITRNKTHRQKYLGGRVLTGDKPDPAKPAPGQQEPLETVWTFCDEDEHQQTTHQADEENSSSDCYLEYTVRGDSSEPILEEDIHLRYFDNHNEESEQELSQQALRGGSLLECYLECMEEESEQELLQNVGENSRAENSENVTGKKLPPEGGIPNTNSSDPKEVAEFAEKEPSRNEEQPAPRKYVCPHSGCSRNFISRSSLRRHVRIHGPRNCICTECGKAFISYTKLNRHSLVHSGERKYQCTFEGCGRRFSLDFNLRTHVRIHTGEKPFVCPFDGCPMRFTRSKQMKAHILSHAKTRKNQ